MVGAVGLAKPDQRGVAARLRERGVPVVVSWPEQAERRLSQFRAASLRHGANENVQPAARPILRLAVPLCPAALLGPLAGELRAAASPEVYTVIEGRDAADDRLVLVFVGK